MYIKITDTQQLTPGSLLKRINSEEYFELGDYSEPDNAYFVTPEGISGSFSKSDNLGMGVSAEHLMENYLIEDSDVGFYDEGEGSSKGLY